MKEEDIIIIILYIINVKKSVCALATNSRLQTRVARLAFSMLLPEI